LTHKKKIKLKGVTLYLHFLFISKDYIMNSKRRQTRYSGASITSVSRLPNKKVNRAYCCLFFSFQKHIRVFQKHPFYSREICLQNQVANIQQQRKQTQTAEQTLES